MKFTVKQFTFHIITLGCPKNEVETNRLKAALKNLGWTEAGRRSAEIIIVNTCSFIEDALEETLKTIKQTEEDLRLGQRVIVFGCLVNLLTKLSPTRLKKSKHWGSDVLDSLAIRLTPHKNPIPIHPDLPYYALAESGSYFLRISDGCNNNCSYCCIPFIRGPLNSRTLDELMPSINDLKRLKPAEVNIIAQDTSSWGKDRGEFNRHKSLLESLSYVPWIRLLYWNPSCINNNLFELYKDFKNLVSYLETPIQHVSSRILKRMNREKQDTAKLREGLLKLKEIRPDIMLRTTLMVGFPGETELEFMELVDFIKEGLFTWIGLFAFSPMLNTIASSFGDILPRSEILDRYNYITEIRDKICQQRLTQYIDKTLKVLLVSRDKEGLHGRPYFSAPEIDGDVIMENYPKGVRLGNFVDVRINEVLLWKLYGEMINGDTT